MKNENEMESVMSMEILRKDMEEAERKKAERMAAYITLLKEKLKDQTDDIIDTLVKYRKEQGLTQENVADRVGVKTANVARFELKKSNPSLQFLTKYADALGYDIDITLKKRKSK